jgi:dienelactone hydrolase
MRNQFTRHVLAMVVLPFLISICLDATTADAQPPQWKVGGELARYFASETAAIQDASLTRIDSMEQWQDERPQRKRQLLEMLGLQPLPEKTPLYATTTGHLKGDGFRVENVHFQSRPGLYVTGNLYLPRELDRKYPAILYVCGHGGVKKNGVSYGNKVHYQHHGAWFARNGFVCLTIDTLQLGEIEGIHHGTYRYDRWWWVSRGYTPAGVEAWNCIRALDYLSSRPEVDAARLGVSGRSGGGAYSWWVASTDSRVKVAVPVAGITDLQDHVVRGCVEGHCDCMYMLNTYRWDYYDVAAMVAPRPLLISNTDRDRIFPLGGVMRTYSRVAKIYDLLGKREDLAIQITAGPHQDTQELRVHAFRWFNHYLRDTDELIEKTATKFFEPEELKVFSTNPVDEINTSIDEIFVPAAESLAALLKRDDFAGIETASKTWERQLRNLSFRGWPVDGMLPSHELLNQVQTGDVDISAIRMTTQPNVSTALLWMQRGRANRAKLLVLNDETWDEWSDIWKRTISGAAPQVKQREFITKQIDHDTALVVFVPRGQGPYLWTDDAKKANQIRRRFCLLGQTQDAMRIWDIRQATRLLRKKLPDAPLELRATGTAAGLTLYASLFEPAPERLSLAGLARSHRNGPTLMNVLRFMDIPHAVAMAASRGPLEIAVAPHSVWDQLADDVRKLGVLVTEDNNATIATFLLAPEE